MGGDWLDSGYKHSMHLQCFTLYSEVIQSIPQERISERTIGQIVHSVGPSSQSTAHAEACSVIVERVDMELGAFPPPRLPTARPPRAFFCVWQRDFLAWSDVSHATHTSSEDPVSTPLLEQLVLTVAAKCFRSVEVLLS